MAFLGIFGKREEEKDGEELPASHCTMVPYWERPEDIGNERHIDGYRCPACGQLFSIEEGERFLAAERRRLMREFSLDATK